MVGTSVDLSLSPVSGLNLSFSKSDNETASHFDLVAQFVNPN